MTDIIYTIQFMKAYQPHLIIPSYAYLAINTFIHGTFFEIFNSTFRMIDIEVKLLTVKVLTYLSTATIKAFIGERYHTVTLQKRGGGGTMAELARNQHGTSTELARN